MFIGKVFKREWLMRGSVNNQQLIIFLEYSKIFLNVLGSCSLEGFRFLYDA